jgi:hypothetical protein
VTKANARTANPVSSHEDGRAIVTLQPTNDLLVSPTSCGSLIPSEDGRLFPSKQHAYRWLLYRIRPTLNGMVSHVPFTFLQGSCHDVRSRCELPRDLARQIEDT